MLKDFWEFGLLTSTDIKGQRNFLYQYYSQHKYNSQMRFEYLPDIWPEALKIQDDTNENQPLFHFIVKKREVKYESMQLFLRAALKHFSNDLGFLFQKIAFVKQPLN